MIVEKLRYFSARDDFPVASLPPWARAYVTSLAHVLQVEPAAIALSVLGAVAIAVQSKAEVVVRGGWIEPLAFWSLVALRSGNRKSPALLRPLAPIRNFEKAENAARERYRERIRDRRLQAHRSQGKPDPTLPDPFKLAEPPPLELFGSDLTPESLALALAEQQESYAVVTDEPTSLAAMLSGLYSEGQQPNTGLYMAGFSGSPYRRRRVKGTNATLERPTLSMVLIGQPSVFDSLTNRSQLVDLGFVGRFLVAKPTDHLGDRDVHDDVVPPEVSALYAEQMTAILHTPWREPPPDVRALYVSDPPPPWPREALARHWLQLTPEARELHMDTEGSIEPLLAEDGPLGELSDFGAKLSGQIARAAALLHAMTHPTDWTARPIEAGTVADAIEIGRYAFGEVQRIWGYGAQAMAEWHSADHVRRTLEILQDRGASGSVTWARLRRQLVHGNGRGRIATPQDLEAVLEELCDRGEIEEVPSQTSRGRRWRIRTTPIPKPKPTRSDD